MKRRVHATEQQLGYYRKYRTRHGDVLRFIRMQATPTITGYVNPDGSGDGNWSQPEPEPETWGEFWRALATMLLIVAAGYALVLAAAAYAP